jgi:hypothetical protein
VIIADAWLLRERESGRFVLGLPGNPNRCCMFVRSENAKIFLKMALPKRLAAPGIRYPAIAPRRKGNVLTKIIFAPIIFAV